MSFVTARQKNGKTYYYLSGSKKHDFKSFTQNKSLYLGRYKKACRKIKKLKISQERKEKILKEILTEEEASLNNIAIPSQKYNCIAIDPPWFYQLRKDDKTHRNRIPYPPMKLDEILALPIPELCSKDGTVLWLWFTNNHMIEASKCIESWGFELKTILTWLKVSKAGKPRIGTGHWLRNCTEHCILATKGKVTSFSHAKTLTNDPTILMAPRRQHSRKPDEFYELAEKLCSGKKLEMFARQRRPGWDAWGDEIDKFESKNLPSELA